MLCVGERKRVGSGVGKSEEIRAGGSDHVGAVNGPSSLLISYLRDLNTYKSPCYFSSLNVRQSMYKK